MRQLYTIACAALFAACAAPQKPAATDAFVALDRDPCYGRCPVYQVELHADGSAIYNGIGFVCTKGEVHYKVDPHAVEGLLEKAKVIGLWQFDDSYDRHVSDWPSATVTLREGSRRKTIFEEPAGHAGPKALSEFATKIDEVSQVARFILDADGKECRRP